MFCRNYYSHKYALGLLVRRNVFYHPSHNHMATIVSTKIPQLLQLLLLGLQKNIQFILLKPSRIHFHCGEYQITTVLL